MLCINSVLVIFLATAFNMGNGKTVVSLTLSVFNLKYLYLFRDTAPEILGAGCGIGSAKRGRMCRVCIKLLE